MQTIEKELMETVKRLNRHNRKVLKNKEIYAEKLVSEIKENK